MDQRSKYLGRAQDERAVGIQVVKSPTAQEDASDMLRGDRAFYVELGVEVLPPTGYEPDSKDDYKRLRVGLVQFLQSTGSAEYSLPGRPVGKKMMTTRGKYGVDWKRPRPNSID